VQTPTKYETVLNRKTAKALGLPVPADLLVVTRWSNDAFLMQRMSLKVTRSGASPRLLERRFSRVYLACYAQCEFSRS
jgi:hypothetical protein